MDIQLRTKDHPEANGREPIVGEKAYMLTFPLENGTNLLLFCGEQTMLNFSSMIGQMLIDNETERTENEHS